MVNVPIQFQLTMPYRYPADNETEFERWYFENHNIEQQTERVYLPIFWTAYYVRHGITRDTFNTHALYTLQEYINSLDSDKKYYTIVQHDDGILHDLSRLDIKVFGMGGGKFDYPLPLISEPHKWDFPHSQRTILASFVGQITHPCREQIYNKYKTDQDIFVSKQKLPLQEYCQVMSRSIFALCPRGYGPTSFRIQEAIQYGSIPIYISDEFIEPYGIDFSGYGLKLTIESVCGSIFKSLLKNVDTSQFKKNNMKNLFSYQGCKEAIFNYI